MFVTFAGVVQILIISYAKSAVALFAINRHAHPTRFGYSFRFARNVWMTPMIDFQISRHGQQWLGFLGHAGGYSIFCY